MLQNITAKARQLREDEGGFTLIELLVVIVILGILAAVVVFSVRGVTDRGDVAACKTNQSTAQTAVEAYYAKEGSNPGSLGALVPDYLKTDPSASTVDAKIRVGYAAGTVTPGTACAPATP